MNLIAGILAAAVASLAINGSYLVQHAGLSSAPAIRTVTVVQSVIAAGLVVITAGSVRVTSRPPRRRELAGVLLIAPALVALAIAPALITAPAASAPGLAAFLAVAGVAGALLARGAGAGRLGLASGILYGATTVALAEFLHTWPGTVSLVAAGGGAVVTTLGFFAFQRGLQLGRPVPVVTLMTAATNVVAIGGGLLLLATDSARPPRRRRYTCSRSRPCQSRRRSPHLGLRSL
jgi:hypothetical protein